MTPKTKKPKTFGEIIYALRKAKGWSRSKLSRVADVSEGMIVKYEHELSTPGFDVAVKLATALGVSVSELVGDAKP